MADREELSSSEQYVKKSNRRLLVFALVAFFAFLIGLLLLSGGSRDVEETEKPVLVIEEPHEGTKNGNSYRFDKSSDKVDLTAYPTSISLTNVPLGGNAEGIITLSAKSGPVLIEGMHLAQEGQQDGFIISQTEKCGVGKTIPAGESCNHACSKNADGTWAK